jgi:LysR family transcriptional regulator, flagellar master operon regulator
VEAGRLHLVAGAPRFSYPVYVVYSASADEGVLAPALAGLRTLTTVKGNS